MKIVIFGLSVSSSWGNGHAALWRGLIRALLRERHQVVFFERDVPYYAEHRDLGELPDGGRLILYPDWHDIQSTVLQEIAGADVGIVTSYCPDGRAAAEYVLDSNLALRCFYDLDTPVTLARLAAGEDVDYVAPYGLAPFDLVLSYTGGTALAKLRTQLGARRTVPIYGSVDPEVHYPTAPCREYECALSYLGTYAVDRQNGLQSLLVDPANILVDSRFMIAGAQYPEGFPWSKNIYFVRHLPVADHAAFYSSSKLTLNVTRKHMAAMGWCPSGRLFEAAACGTPILSDWFEGLDEFYKPGSEILIANSTGDALEAIRLEDSCLASVAKRARERTMDEHTSARRAAQMIAAFESDARVIA